MLVGPKDNRVRVNTVNSLGGQIVQHKSTNPCSKYYGYQLNV